MISACSFRLRRGGGEGVGELCAVGGKAETIPARERLSGPAPVEQLRWAHCPDDGHLHLLQPAEVVVAAAGDHAEALCGQALPAEGLILTPLTNGSPDAPFMTCVDGIPFPSSDSGPRGTP